MYSAVCTKAGFPVARMVFLKTVVLFDIPAGYDRRGWLANECVVNP